MEIDRRAYPRLPLALEVELYEDGKPMRVVRTEDLSSGGTRLILDGTEAPPPGTRIRVRVVGFLGDGDQPPIVDATVVRHSGDGVAIRFI